MADTAVSPNNRAVVYRGKPQRERPRMSGFAIDPTGASEGGKGQRMPVVSQAQNAAMHSAAEGRSTLGIPKSVGREFTADQAPGSVKKLPKRVSAMHKRGRISNKAKTKLDGKYGGKDQQGIDAASR